MPGGVVPTRADVGTSAVVISPEQSQAAGRP